MLKHGLSFSAEDVNFRLVPRMDDYFDLEANEGIRGSYSTVPEGVAAAFDYARENRLLSENALEYLAFPRNWRPELVDVGLED